MGKFNLNLSTRPFKPHRAANLGLLILLLVLGAVSTMQFYAYKQNSSLAGSIRGTLLQKKAESEQLTKAQQLLNAKMFSGKAEAKMSQVEILNQILLRKSFSWTKVFANLEAIIPENVYLMSLRPFVDEQGKMGLNIVFRGKSFADGHEFVRTMEGSPIFSNIALAVEEIKDSQAMPGEVEMVLSAYYVAAPEKGAE